MSRNIDDVRDHLFAALEGLRDKANPMEIERAKAISEVAQTIINSAKVEVDYLRANGGNGGTSFLERKATALPPGVTGVKVHRLKG